MSGIIVTSGSTIARAADDGSLVIADEDHHALRVVALPLVTTMRPSVVDLPGAPAEVVALGDRVLVTVREPGLLVELVKDGTTLRETGRVELPWDAWGVGVSADGKTAVVTSAWTHRISGVDLVDLKVRWSLVAAREPRGVAIAADGTTYVGHLVGSRVTRIQGIDGATPKLERLDVAPSLLRSAPKELLDASLAFAPVLSPSGDRLFLPRHALGAQGDQWWFGAGTVDVVTTKDFAPLSPAATTSGGCGINGERCDENALAPDEPNALVSPRAAVYRKTTSTLLVASEGTNDLIELDAHALDPSLARKRSWKLGKREGKEAPATNVVVSGGAPSGIALSADEKVAYVFCRSTYDLATVALEGGAVPSLLHLADDTLGDKASRGRRLFYDAEDTTMSGGLSCAGCHPDGRDDGHVWHEIDEGKDGPDFTGYRGATIVRPAMFGSVAPPIQGVGRQTPMLAGRIAGNGPFGWRAESPNLETRVRVGFNLHRWNGHEKETYSQAMERPELIAAFVREGLVAPGAPPRDRTEEEQRGEAIFKKQDVGCARCHNPDTRFTSADLATLDRSFASGFDPEPSTPFKVPSLLYVGGTPPYYHDGLVSSLEALVDNNANAMGDTRRLDASERGALVAYLRTIGGYVEPFPSDEAPKRPVVPDVYASSVHPGRQPQHAEWNSAPVVGKVGGCTLKKSGVFYELACSEGHGAYALAGSTTGTERWAAQGDGFNRPPSWFVFSVEPGDRRILQVTREVAQGRWGTRSVGDGVVQAFWLPGDAEPTITIGETASAPT